MKTMLFKALKRANALQHADKLHANNGDKVYVEWAGEPVHTAYINVEGDSFSFEDQEVDIDSAGYVRIHCKDAWDEEWQIGLTLSTTHAVPLEWLQIDWQLFAVQKLWLICMTGTPGRDATEVEIIDGIINMMDAIQDTVQEETQGE